MKKLKVIDKRNENKKEKKNEQQLPKQVPLKTIICPACKHKDYSNQFIYNQQLNYTVCPKCGIMFMNPMVVKTLLKHINSKIQVVKNVNN